MSNKRKKSNVVVKVLDLSGLEADAFKHVQENGYKEDVVAVRVRDEYGYVETSDGLYFLCSEGVGNEGPITKDNLAELVFARHFERDGEKTFEIFSCLCMKFDDKDIKELPVKSEVTLDKFIRAFGSRLESNFSQWESLLSKGLVNV